MSPVLSLQELVRKRESIAFTVDWGVFNPDFCLMAFGRVPSSPTVSFSPFIARLVPGPQFVDQWWELDSEGAWTASADGTRNWTDFAEMDAGIEKFLRLTSNSVSLADVVLLGSRLVSEGVAVETFTPNGRALDILRSSESVQGNLALPAPQPFEWFMLETFDLDPEARSSPGTVGDFQVTFSDEVALDYAELVTGSVSVIESFPGVRAVLHENRDTVKVWGTVDLTALESELRAWWARHLSDASER
jgi:hypothetical protein